MIIDFAVTNFRSIKNEQLFSMFAESKPQLHSGNIVSLPNDINVLKVAAIFGANASGKSNLLLAFEALQNLMIESGDRKDGDDIPEYEPYILSVLTETDATKFEVEFTIGDDRFKYYIQYDKKNILFEKLDQYKTIKSSNIFTRNSPDDWNGVKFGDSYKGGRRKFAFFSNNSYLSKAGNSPDSPKVIRDVFNYFRKNIDVIMSTERVGVLEWENNSAAVEIVTKFLKHADFGIDKFDLKQHELPAHFSLPEDMPDDIKDKLKKKFSKKEVFYHTSEDGQLIPFDKHMESKGTRRLFELLPYFLIVLKEGTTAFIDEIESSLHPHIAELIVKIFNDPSINLKNAQLIFTTHDVNLMSQSKLRKDQIYLSRKTHAQGTEYNDLSYFDESLKDNSPFSKWYNEGRLGGIPDIDYKIIGDAIKGIFTSAKTENKE
ncbi:AAA family ATPase [Rheinheimera sp. MM224]|uniref:AAA family ATPase n=1 Tax=Rheinheimera sp. MM224 TaxID=3019969 RepID=UPI0021F9044E|nr:ATP-binding protein [Rheinheimera sp. MM224]CAI3795258.1 hypothetical protein JAMGFMIE_01273 [Rheinheimera sp. MM224]